MANAQQSNGKPSIRLVDPGYEPLTVEDAARVGFARHDVAMHDAPARVPDWFEPLSDEDRGRLIIASLDARPTDAQRVTVIVAVTTLISFAAVLGTVLWLYGAAVHRASPAGDSLPPAMVKSDRLAIAGGAR